MKHTQQKEQAIVAGAMHGDDALCLHAFADWDGMVEVSRVVDVGGYIERIDVADEEQVWASAPFWSVYLHQSVGGVDCVADLRTEGEAHAFAAGLIAMREHLQSIKEPK